MPTPFNSKYSSTEIENFFDLLNSNSFITNTVSNLVNYYLKSDTYSKSEVDSIINTVKNGRFQNVNSLPEQDIDTNVIYLVQKQNTENNNIKDEYINLDGTSTGWEKIGSTEINLDGYVTIQALNTALNNYVQSSNIVTILANRTSFSSVENMVATSAADLYDGCLAYVTGTKKNYQYDSSNDTDPTLGKWREFSSGGSGGSTYTAGDGIDITNDVISTKQSEEGDIDEIIDVYPQAGSLVSIVNAFNKGDIYSTDEKMIGQWIDGKPLYQKSITGVSMPQTENEWVTICTLDSSARIVSVESKMDVANSSVSIQLPYSGLVNLEYDNNLLKIQTAQNYYRNNTVTATIQYTKTTDTAISIGSETEYSTDEKVVGTWIDGKPLYQKTWNNLNLQLNANSWTNTSITTNGLSKLIGAVVHSSNGTVIASMNCAIDGNYVNINNTSQTVLYADSLTLQYTKSTT